MARRGSPGARAPQLAYSEIQHETHDERKRRVKAAKIVRVLQHFFGRIDLQGLRAVDIGCSTGFTAAALAEAGATVVGLDIDIPGLAHAAARFGNAVQFTCADGAVLPLSDASVDIVVFNHIYEHVVDADAVMSEISRVLRPDGGAYLGFGNRMQIIEPHYRLPFLSWLPLGAADRYVSLSKRAPRYYERFRTRAGLLRMAQGLHLWDYTYTVLGDSERFAAQDLTPRRLDHAPMALWHALAPVMPTYIWVGTPGSRQPAGGTTREPPTLLNARFSPHDHTS